VVPTGRLCLNEVSYSGCLLKWSIHAIFGKNHSNVIVYLLENLLSFMILANVGLPNGGDCVLSEVLAEPREAVFKNRCRLNFLQCTIRG
jgi:hypothetical protein